MGAITVSHLQTQHDVVRMSVQVKGSPFELSPTVTDTPAAGWNSLMRKRSLVQIQYGPLGKRQGSQTQGPGQGPARVNGQGKPPGDVTGATRPRRARP